MVKYNIDLRDKTILITGAAGFIGSNLARRLCVENENARIIGIDNINDYYDTAIKESRLNELKTFANFTFVKENIANKKVINELFEQYSPDIVINLAAQAGVRYSIVNPDVYIESNIIGFYNLLEACRHSYDGQSKGVIHFVYASSSSIYGNNTKLPYSIKDKTDHPISLYAATKKSNELLAYAYSKLYHIPSTGLRFFTVYGPAGRPDMAYFSFADKLKSGGTIQIYNYGNCKRDFTYIDDVVESLNRVVKKAPDCLKRADGLIDPPYKIYNVGNSHPESLLEFVDILQQELITANVLPTNYDFESHKKLIAMQPGDVPITYADTSELERELEFKPCTPLRDGLRKFAEWYADFYCK